MNWTEFHTFVKVTYWDYTVAFLGGKPTGQELHFVMDFGQMDLTSTLVTGKEVADIFSKITGCLITHVTIGKTWTQVYPTFVPVKCVASRVLHVATEVYDQPNPAYVNFTFEIPGPEEFLTENSAILKTFIDKFAHEGGFGLGNYAQAISQKGMEKDFSGHVQILALGYGYSGVWK